MVSRPAVVASSVTTSGAAGSASAIRPTAWCGSAVTAVIARCTSAPIRTIVLRSNRSVLKIIRPARCPSGRSSSSNSRSSRAAPDRVADPPVHLVQRPAALVLGRERLEHEQRAVDRVLPRLRGRPQFAHDPPSNGTTWSRPSSVALRTPSSSSTKLACALASARITIGVRQYPTSGSNSARRRRSAAVPKLTSSSPVRRLSTSAQTEPRAWNNVAP